MHLKISEMFHTVRSPGILMISLKTYLLILSFSQPSCPLIIPKNTQSLPGTNLTLDLAGRNSNTASSSGIVPGNTVDADGEKEPHGNYNPWEEFFMEEEPKRSKKAVEEGAFYTTEAEKVTVDDSEKFQETVNSIAVEYVCHVETPEGCKSPLLKYYKMYTIYPEDGFYPCWTYHGFHPPSEWHKVSINFFEKPPPEAIDEVQNHSVRKHGSAMHLCGDVEVDKARECKERMENECANSMPSPINIIKRLAVEDPNLSDIVFINYNVYFGFEMFFEGDGTPLLFFKFLPHVRDGRRPGIRKGPLAHGQELYLDRVLIRYGVDYKTGSEHTVNGEYFGMELQFFFTADDLPYWQALSRYKTFPQGDPRIGQQVHVLSVFVNFVETNQDINAGDDFSGDSMQLLSMAAKKFWEGVNPEHFSTVRVNKMALTLEDFFGQPNTGIYYTYQGSLSHPPCLTHVTWTLFEKPTLASLDIWKAFAYVHSEYSDYRFLAGNIRPQSEILVKADIQMFHQMKRVQGYGDLHQRELDEAAENIREIDNRNRTKKVDLYLIRNYADYQTYFARKVRSRRPGNNNSEHGDNEYDYYEEEKHGTLRNLRESSNAPSIRPSYTAVPTIVSMLILILIINCAPIYNKETKER